MSTSDDSLFWACFRGDKHLVLKLANPNNVNYVSPNQTCATPLHQACKRGWLDVVKLLIEEYGCDPNVRTRSNKSVLYYACQYGHIDIAEYLINKWRLDPLLLRDQLKMVHPNWKTVDGIHFLRALCQSNVEDPKIIELMQHYNILKDGMNPDNTFLDSKGNTVLHIACQANKLAVVSYLIDQAHCDPNIKNKTGSLPLGMTTNPKVIIYLCQHDGVAVYSKTIIKWMNNLRSIDDTTMFSILKSLVENHRYKTEDGSTLLHVLCMHSFIRAYKERFVDFLLTEGHCDPNCLDSNGDMPLQVTSSPRIMTKLIEHGAKMTADVVFKLMMSSEKDSVIHEMVVLSIRKQAMLWNPNELNGDGYTALHLACKADNPTRVNILLSEAHCDPNCLDGNGKTPLQVTSDSRIMTKLLEHGARMTADIVFKLMMSNEKDSVIHEILVLSIRKQAMLWNPNELNGDGYTALHLACKADNPTRANILLSEAHCDPNCLDGNGKTPLQVTSDSRIMTKLLEHGARMTADIVFKLMMSNEKDSIIHEILVLSIRKQAMLWNPNELNGDGYTALHLACKTDNPSTVNILLSEAHCDPNCFDGNGKTPIQVTSDSRIMTILIEYGAKMTADVVFKLMMSNEKDSVIHEILVLSISKQAMLWNPNELNGDGYTALHLACKADNPTRVNILLSEAHCDPNCLDGNGKTPFQVTSDSRIMTILIEHGAKMIAGDVFELIISDKTDSIINEILTLSIRKQAILWNPNELNGDGYTALHLACKTDNLTRVNILLSGAHCDPNAKSNNEKVPLQMTTNPEIIKDLIRHGAKTSIMYESYQNSLGTNKPVQPPVKVFVVGNTSVGKSTLTAVLKKKIGVIARIFSGKVSGVDKNTVGIVPHDIESDTFGKVTLYDFAGHREFYSGHAALLQTAIQSSPPVFLLVVNLCEQEDEIIKNILYWTSFLESQCASVSCKPHIVLVGSHADMLKGTNRKDKVKMITESLKKNNYCFTNMEYVGFVAMNCQYHESTGMSDLRHLLIKSCDELRIQEPITFNAHCFLVFLIDKFMDFTAVQIKTISKWIDNHPLEGGVLEFLPKGIEMLYKICLELNDRGHILLLKDRIAIENSYIVIDKEFLLSKISGTVFAPEGFKQYKELSTNTGVVPLSKIKECFPDKDLDILIGFLIYLEFCHEISDEALHQLISEQYSQGSSERYYLFPGLISLKADEMVWRLQSEYDYNYCGWILKCTHPEQFFSSRFLHVLLLRLAFSFALDTSYDNPNQRIVDNPNQSVGIHRNCCLWKNGISWGSVFGMQTLVEVTPDNKSVVLLARFHVTNLLRCVKHRSEVISTILQCKKQFCSRLFVVEIFIDSSSPLHYPLSLTNEINICTLQDLATAVMSDYECPSIVLQSHLIPARNFLSFEPYLEMKLSTIQELWDEINENKAVSDAFLSNLQKGSGELNSFMDQLYQDLLRWRDSDQRTYKELRQKVDQYSIFAGRNVLVSYCFERSCMIIISCGF